METVQMHPVTPQWLQEIEDVREVPDDQLQWWIDNSEYHFYAQDDYAFRQNEPTPGTFIIISGKLRLFATQAKGERFITFFEPRQITGYLPFSRAAVAIGSCIAVEDTEVLILPREKIKELIVQHYELTQALVHIMTSRVRTFTAMQQQNEKMMALGKLSAGLAHELNNPAAAIVRGSISLKKHLQLSPAAFKDVMNIKISGEQVDRVSEKLFEVLSRKDRPLLTLMQRTDLEDEFDECLTGHGVKNSQELAENFIEFGFTCQDMDELGELVPAEYLSPVLNWVNDNLVTERMVNDLEEASQRISKLVSSIKNFTHMDRGSDKEFIDIHSGIRNTIIMLQYKFKKGNVELVEDYDTSLPKVKVLVGELNQVWTNLIDNALDAMEANGKGKLTITTQRERNDVITTITDDGPGIPEEIQNQVFDPFFTTKEIGKGTGLGLDVVTRIVNLHHGSIKLESKPGHTSFRVCFPINGD